jgi:uncharacterized protein with NRDE domain
MCLITLAWQAHPDYPLILAANRDEFYQRAATPARFWDESPLLLAGRDLSAGGTWLGVTRQGRVAALTNYREPGAARGERSRGLLVSAFLQGDSDPMAYAQAVAGEGEHYGGFNLLLGTPHEMVVVSNRGMAPRHLPAGVHGLSNHLLDTPWPKVEKAKSALSAQLAAPTDVALLQLLADHEIAADAQLPDTGVGLMMERMLSPLFIRSPQYGTRVSTVLMVGRGRIHFTEQTFNEGEPGEVSHFSFDRLPA